MKKLFTTLQILICTSIVSANTLIVQIIDKTTKEPLPFVPVQVNSDSKSYVANSDFKGNCRFTIPSGKYVLKTACVGYRSLTQNVTVRPGTQHLSIQLERSSVSLEEVIVIEYNKPIIDPDTKSGGTVTREEWSMMATKNVISTSSSVAGVVSRDEGKELSVRGSRGGSSSYVYVDGVKVRGGSAVEVRESEVKEESPSAEKVREEKVREEKEGKATSAYKPGLLTATELNDFSKWELWKDLSDDQLKGCKEFWNLSLKCRYTVLLVNQSKRALIDIPVYLYSTSGELLWSARTDNTGKAELWNGLSGVNEKGKVYIEVKHEGNSFRIDDATQFEKGINRLVLKTSCPEIKTADIAFVVDATGSMGDEIEYLKSELGDIINKVTTKNTSLTINLGGVFYRDHGDAYVTVHSDLSPNHKKTLRFIEENSDNGGGDFPEALDEAIEVAVSSFGWSEQALTRIVFLILDAPSHNQKENQERLTKQIMLAAEKGIKIIPVLCSGAGQNTEYLMRVMELATNGSFIMLTDHSGIGGKHDKPTTDEYKVSYLNDVLIDVITRNLYTVPCEQTFNVQKTDTMIFMTPRIIDLVKNANIVSKNESLPKDTIVTLLNQGQAQDFQQIRGFRYYPNPATDFVTVEIQNAKRIFLCDLTGKILEDVKPADLVTIDVTGYPVGPYFIKALVDEKWITGKLVKQ